MLEVVLVIAALAILAGVMSPFALREINAAKTSSTEEEMQAIENGLAAYYHDCGRLPATAAGLAALVRNVEGIGTWGGPYISGKGDIEADVAVDAWGETYTYVNQPNIQGTSTPADYILLSPGADRMLDSSAPGGVWTLDPDEDLVLQGVTRSVDDAWKWDTEKQLRETAEALAQYYVDVGSFPGGVDSTALSQLLSSGASGWNGPYLHGTAAAVAHDAWRNELLLRNCTQVNGQAAVGRILVSLGPGPPDASAVGQSWTTGSNDIWRVVVQSPLDAHINLDRRNEALQQLRLLAGEIYVANPAGSPATYVLPDTDPWGYAYRYQMKTALSGVVYSIGPDGLDEGGTDDDPAESLLWQP
jgi:type II secretion system protein G